MQDYSYADELLHYGVKGMKWGVRNDDRISNLKRRYDDSKSNYKMAKRAYSKSFNAAYNRSISAWSPIKKHREENDKRWEKAFEDAKKVRDAESKYKKIKKDRKNKIKNVKSKIEKESSIGDKLMYNSATRKKAAKYVVDNDMPVSDAIKRAKGDAWRNSVAFVAAYGAFYAGMSYLSK